MKENQEMLPSEDSNRLRQLDELIDSQIPLHLLRDLDLDQAVQAILILNDVYGVADLPNVLISNKESDNAIRLAQMQLQEAQRFCIKWIYQECNQSKSASNTDFWPSLKKLYEFARQYADIWTTMSALHQGVLRHSFCSDGCIEIEYVSKQQGQIRVTDAILSSRIYFTSQANLAVSQVLEHSIHQNLQSCLNSLVSIAQGKTSIDLSFPKDSFVELVEANNELLDVLWSLNKDWRFCGYSLAELKRVYSVIKARTQIQTGIWIPLFLSTRKTEIFNRIALKQPREHWLDELTEFAGLPRSTVESILSDLTYKSRQRPAMSPSRCAFLELSNNFLVLNNSQVNFANSENDAWMSLVDRKDPLHGILSSMKEAVQLTQIRQWLEPLEYRLFGPLQYRHLGKAGDVDLLVLSEKEKFGLVCELKWPALPNSVAREDRVKSEFAKGKSQAKAACDWIVACPNELAQKIALDADELRSYEFQPIVISKTVQDSSGELNDVPVTNDYLFRTILDAPYSAPLRKLWSILRNKTYYAKPGIHYEERAWESTCGSVKFFSKGTSCVPLRNWDPLIDLDHSSQ